LLLLRRTKITKGDASITTEMTTEMTRERAWSGAGSPFQVLEKEFLETLRKLWMKVLMKKLKKMALTRIL
jgi:hypothetical protein